MENLLWEWAEDLSGRNPMKKHCLAYVENWQMSCQAPGSWLDNFKDTHNKPVTSSQLTAEEPAFIINLVGAPGERCSGVNREDDDLGVTTRSYPWRNSPEAIFLSR
jgi:hypothetical protein